MMSEKCYRIADVCFAMHCQGELTRKMCADYEVDVQEKPSFDISVTEEEVDREGVSEDEKYREYLESLALYRKLCEKMLDYDTFLFHCSAIEVEGKAYLFAAPSGTGKSTHTRMWREYFGEKAVMINDDKPLLKVRQDGIYVCGTPWNGKHHLDTNKIVPIQGICLLERGSENHIEKIAALDAYPGLYRQTYRPADREKMVRTLALLRQLTERVSIYRMQCTISQDAAIMAWNAMKE